MAKEHRMQEDQDEEEERSNERIKDGRKAEKQSLHSLLQFSY